MERSRNAEMKRYFETMSKAALVNNIKVGKPIDKEDFILFSPFQGITKTCWWKSIRLHVEFE